MIRFLHTADWQIGKPFQSISDSSKRERLRQQRLDTVRYLQTLIEEHQIDFVVVCGDLFDSSTPDAATVSALCSAIGHLKVPVYAIPGNHDHAGPGCIWEQAFFLREQRQLAPNLHLLLERKELVLDHAVLLPCPLLRRHESEDPSAWLRREPEGLPHSLPRIVLAHGSTQGFSSSGETDSESGINRIQLEHLPAYDYIALGDWHGLKQIAPSAWYCGTPEQDRFAKGDANLPGHVLLVETDQSQQTPRVKSVQTGKITWHSLDPFSLAGDADLDFLESQLSTLLGGQTNCDLLQFEVSGTLSFSGLQRFEQLIEILRARLIRLDLEQEIRIEPSDEELNALTQRQDPLIASVARELRESLDKDPLARESLRELQLQTTNAIG